MNKTERCFRCSIKIDLVTSAYHEGMCVSCYRDLENGLYECITCGVEIDENEVFCSGGCRSLHLDNIE